jgi:hypothetical protein
MDVGDKLSVGREAKGDLLTVTRNRQEPGWC